MPVRKINRIPNRIERSTVNVARLQAHDQWVAAGLRESACQRIKPDPTLIISRNGNAARLTEAKEPQGHLDGFVLFLADDHRHLRCAMQTVALNIPAHSA